MNYMKRTKVMLLAVFEFLSAVFATSFFSLSFSIGKRSTLAGASPPPSTPSWCLRASSSTELLTLLRSFSLY